MNDLAQGYFGEEGMLAYVKGVQRQEIRKGVACVKHQRMRGPILVMIIKHSSLEIIKRDGAKNTSDQFESKKNEPSTCLRKIIFILINDKGNMITCCLFILSHNIMS
jgi:hypothetical protein